ncbi:hypothetical protein [Micromonospora sediminicola]|uniref:hypothetical protein n=1 Tax=Micromonospora sediminicola TaxID=946078 RepID=UPI0037B531A3
MVCISGDLADPGFKAFTLDTPLATPTGWTTILDLRPGVELLDERGYATPVLAVTDPTTYRTCQKVRFDDGAELIAHSGNSWSAINSGRRARARQGVVDWRDRWDLAERVLGPALERRSKIGASSASNWSIPLCRPLELGDGDLPLPPYVLGAWLGDGCKDSATMTTCDQWMIEEFRRQGMAVSMRAARVRDRSVDFGFRPDDGVLNLPDHKGRGKTQLKAAGVFQNKHFPQGYLRGSRQQRLDLLRGFMDTDGFWMGARSAAVEQRDRVLAEGLVELVRSLGWRAFMTAQSRPHPNRPGDIYHYWHVNFTPTECPFALPRKASRWSGEADRRHTHRTVVSVEAVTRRRVRAVKVAGMFLAGSGMVPV